MAMSCRPDFGWENQIQFCQNKAVTKHVRGGGAFLFLPSDSLRTAQPGIEPSSANKIKRIRKDCQEPIKATDTRICSVSNEI
jgi:hypothetical protein